VALDRLSNGRLTLGIGAGAVWMGWHAFPDVETGTKARAEMLDETIDIVTLFFEGEPFDFDGRHNQLQLTALDVMFYPPRPVQQPRIPIWVPGLWPRKQSMERVLRCDGILPEKVGEDGRAEAITPDDVRAIKQFVDERREMRTPFDIVVSGKTRELPADEREMVLKSWADAGVTWWIEDMIAERGERLEEAISMVVP
jgi:hypothetical protein